MHRGAGSDAIHTNGEYAFAVTQLHTDCGLTGCGITLTMGKGNRVVCDLIDKLTPSLVGREIEELMAEFGAVSQRLADDPALRWLGPHKGAVHLALASVVNACFDLWAKSRGVPLWRLLLDLTPAQVVALLDLSYVEDVLSAEDAMGILNHHLPTGRAAKAFCAADIRDTIRRSDGSCTKTSACARMYRPRWGTVFAHSS